MPGLEEFAGDSPPNNFLPDNWVFGGELGQRIFDDVMSMDSKSLMDSCRDMFNKHENCPVLLKEAGHTGFSELIRVQGMSFHEDPGRLWNGPLIGWKVRVAKEMVAERKKLSLRPEH